MTILLATATVAANAQTTIPPMKPIPPVKPIPKVCDPNAWGNYLRKKRISEELIDNWLQRAHDADHKFADDLLEIIHDYKEVKHESEKLGNRVKKAEKAYTEYVESRYSVTEAALKKESVAGIGEAAEFGGTVGLVGELALDAAKLDMAWGDYRNAVHANDKDLQRAQALWQSALADLNQALSQTEACQRERDKAKAQDALEERAREMIEEWTLNDVTYHDRSGVTLDEKAALEEAKQILLGQRSGMRRGQPHYRLAAFLHTAMSTPQPIRPDRAAAALIRVQRAHSMFTDSMASIIALTNAELEFEGSLGGIRAGM
jgi:hypothetical protein